jgi:hypothetical protein
MLHQFRSQEMKKQLLLLISSILLGVLVSALVVIGPLNRSKALNRYFNSNVTISNETRATAITGAGVSSITQASKASIKVGSTTYTAYQVTGTNTFSKDVENGKIIIWVVILNQSTQKVSVVIEQFDQTKDVFENVSKIEKEFKDKTATYLSTYDPGAIATGTTVSRKTIYELVWTTVRIHFNIILDPLLDIFGEGYVAGSNLLTAPYVVDAANFSKSSITSHIVIQGKGHVISGTSWLLPGGSPEGWALESSPTKYTIVLDNDYKVLAVLDITINATEGSLGKSTFTDLIGKNIKTYSFLPESTGATYSRDAIVELYKAIKQYVITL